MSADDHMPGGMPERRLDERDDRTGWEREPERGNPATQLCRGVFGQAERCQARLPFGETHCASCHEYIGTMGTGGT